MGLRQRIEVGLGEEAHRDAAGGAWHPILCPWAPRYPEQLCLSFPVLLSGSLLVTLTPCRAGGGLVHFWESQEQDRP